MALIKCKECKKDLSKTAKVCPNCGEITEYGKRSKKELITIITVLIAIAGAIVVCDQMAILKHCDDDDEKRGSICIKRHYSDALAKKECGISGTYIKDGRCWYGSLKRGFPTTKYYCNEGYLENRYGTYECVVETTYNANYKFLEQIFQ